MDSLRPGKLLGGAPKKLVCPENGRFLTENRQGSSLQWSLLNDQNLKEKEFSDNLFAAVGGALWANFGPGVGR